MAASGVGLGCSSCLIVGRPKGGCPRAGGLGVGQEAGGEQGVRGAPESAKALA